MNILGLEIPFLDLIALIWFIFLWVSYSVFSANKKDNNLVKVMHKYRILWIRHMIRRSDRTVDINIIKNLLRTATFFASTSILILAGLVAGLNFAEKGVNLMASLNIQTTIQMWILKVSLLITVFIFAFFKFTWVIRQFNYVSVLIVASPVYKAEDGKINKHKIYTILKYIKTISTMISNAGHHFNIGMRSYYFGLVVLSWFISPVLFILMSILVVCVLYRREFMSKTLILLT